MPHLDITASHFRLGYSHVNGVHTPNVSRKKCVKCAQVVGNAHFSRAYGRTATALALAAYRAIAVRCVLDFSQQQVRRVNEYVALESSEKINLSYWIGMTFAAIAADELLGVSRLTHALRQNGLVKANKKSKSLADLVGKDAQGNWHVIEAKGRQTAPSPADQRHWKQQARTVRSINGTAVSTRSYCVGLIDDPCQVMMVDPPARRRDPLDLSIDPDEFGNGYYEPFRRFLKGDVRIVKRGKRTFVLRVITFDPIDHDYIYVGLEEHLLSKMRSSRQLTSRVKEFEDEGLYVGTDGVAIASSSGPCNL